MRLSAAYLSVMVSVHVDVSSDRWRTWASITRLFSSIPFCIMSEKTLKIGGLLSTVQRSMFSFPGQVSPVKEILHVCTVPLGTFFSVNVRFWEAGALAFPQLGPVKNSSTVLAAIILVDAYKRASLTRKNGKNLSLIHCWALKSNDSWSFLYNSKDCFSDIGSPKLILKGKCSSWIWYLVWKLAPWRTDG